MNQLLNKRKIIFFACTFVIIASAVLSVTFFTQASNSNKYIIDILDEGKNSISSNQDMQITQKIIPGESKAQELVYTMDAKNIVQRQTNVQIAFAVDNSFSMQENGDTQAIKQKLTELSTMIYNQVSNRYISIATNKDIALGATNNRSYINNAINGITFGKGNYAGNAISNAYMSFGSFASDKYIIVLTDSTDSIKDKLLEVTDNDINVITILYDMTNNETNSDNNSMFGDIRMFSDLDEEKMQTIVDGINKSISNVHIENTLTQDILKYFDVEILNNEVNGQTWNVTENGITWDIERIRANENLQLKYKLKIKDDVVIDRNIIYKDLYSAENIKLDYKIYEIAKSLQLEKAKTPLFKICETYSIKIQAVSSANKNLPVEGVKFKVVGKDEGGNKVYEGNHTTDSKGYVTIEGLKTLDKVEYELTPTINQVGYETTESKLIIVDNDYLGAKIGDLKIETDLEHLTPDISERIVEVKYPINVQGFNLHIDLTELNNTNVKLSGVEFRLIQPKLNSKYEMDALYGTTDENGQLYFHPAVMTKAGTYDYILSQMSEVDGYESAGNATLRLTFNNQGKITKAEVKYNDNMNKTYSDEKTVKLNVGNKSALEDPFNFELNLTDANTGDCIVGAKYTVTVTTQNNRKYTYGGNVTDDKGQIKLKLPGSGEVHIAVVEETPGAGYAKQTQAKEFNIHRENKEVKYVYGSNQSSTNDFTLDPLQAEDTIRINIKSTLKQERNVVKVKAIDINELADLGLENVQFELINTATGKIYGPEITDVDGIASFTVDDEKEGRHEYQLKVLNVPYGYVGKTDPININVHFNSNGYIDSVDDTDDQIANIQYSLEENDNTRLHTAYVKIPFNMDANLAYFFQIDLKDIDTNTPIEGATYDVEILAGNFARTIKGRATDANGMISTRIAVDKTKINELTISVKQTGTRMGYKVDSADQEIAINLTNNQITHTPAEVTSKGQGGQLRYAQAKNSNTIVYHHTNRKKDATDVLLNINITTLDKETDAVIGGKQVKITNAAITDNDGNIIRAITDSSGNKLNLLGTTSTTVPEVGYLSYHNLKVIGVPTPGEQEYYLEMVVDGNKIKFKCVFAYNEYNDIIELRTAESVLGNRLIKHKNYNSAETQEGYLSDLSIEIYTDYSGGTLGDGEDGPQGNSTLGLDLRKFDLEDKEKVLYGAKYDLIIERPDGTKIVKSDLEIKEEEIELDEIYMPLNTVIYLTETTAPIGYDVNDTVILKVTEVNEQTNEVTLTLEDDKYPTKRAKLTKEESIKMTDGRMLSQYTLDMYDVQQDKFIFKVTTKDNKTGKGVKGFNFEISNSIGAQKPMGATDAIGEVKTKIGGMYDDQTSPVTYTIKSIGTGTYYKKLQNPIDVIVYFKADGSVDTEKTLNGQTDSRYNLGSTTLGDWYFEGTNIINEKGDTIYNVGIVINVETLDPLKVEIETVNKFTNNAVIEPVNYKITPSVYEAKTEGGSKTLQVYYTESDYTRTYNVTQTVPENYVPATNLNFNVVYDKDGNISSAESTTSDDLEIVSYNGKTLKLRVKIEPKATLTIKNEYYFNPDQPLAGSNFTIAEKNLLLNLKTNGDGQAVGYVGPYGEGEDKVYLVSQTKAQIGYATIDPFEIKVHYDENRQITSAELVEKENKFVEVGFINPSTSAYYGYNKCPNGIITIKVKNYPAVNFNITNINRQNNNPISGTQYNITSTINTSGTGTTNSTGITKAYVDRSGFSTTVTYTIVESTPGHGYQSFGTPIELDVYFDENGFITGSKIKTPNIENVATVSIIDPSATTEDKFVINMELKNNPLFKINVKKVNIQDEEEVIRDVTFELTGVFNSTQYTKDTKITNGNGNATLNIDRTLDNKTMEYTLKETKKSPFYEWLDKDIKLQITYNDTGKMFDAEAYEVLQGNEYIDITNVDPENWEMDITVKNEPIKAFGIHLITDDKQDESKKVETAQWDAYLTDPSQTGFVKDDNYSVHLKSGRMETDSSGNSQLVVGHGEDFQIVGEYTKGAGTRTLRLTTNNAWLPTKYYKNSENIPSSYNLSHYNILIDIDFDDEGKIVGGPRLRTGDNIYTGWLLDGRYVEVSKVGSYGISVKIHYYPLLEFAINTRDIYTGQELSASYQLSTQSPANRSDDGVREGYIGHNYDYGTHWTKGYTTKVGRDADIATLHRIEKNEPYTTENFEINGTIKTLYRRRLYLYETSEPTSPVKFQKYRPWRTSAVEDRCIGELLVYTDEYGEVISSLFDNGVGVDPTYANRGGYSQVAVDIAHSSNNITNAVDIYKYDGIRASDNYLKDPHLIYMTVNYAPITTMQVTAQDATSGARLEEIRFHPYEGGTSQTNNSYEYRSQKYYETGRNGVTGWTYWGANEANGKNIYKINVSDIDSGYFSDSSFTRIEVEVTYDSNGRIANAKVINKNAFGDFAAYVDESCIGTTQVKLIYKLYRKVGMQINKVDKLDQNIKLSAVFDVTNNIDTSGTATKFRINAASHTGQIVGRMLANNTVEYTISEVTVPGAYKPLDKNLKLIVKYNSDGTIANAYPGDDFSKEYLKVNYICKTPRAENELVEKDIEITVLNDRKFAVDLELTDKFYNNIKLANGTFKIVNSKGDQAVGTMITNGSGKISTYVGKVYPGETVEYTLTQEAKLAGYYKLTAPIKFTVTFDNTGKPVDIPVLMDDYSRENSKVLNNDVNKFRDTYTANIRVLNMPETVYLGIHKYDQLSKANLENVQFQVTVEENGRKYTKNITTNAQGIALVELDTFRTQENARSVIYTIHEVEALDTYRKVQDFQIQVLYDANGGISGWQVLSNESNLAYTLYKQGNTSIQKIDDTYAHIRLEVPNDNTYDLIVKDEDINYQGLGIQGTTYDVSVNGVAKNATATSVKGTTAVTNLTDSGDFQIRIAERQIGEGYRANSENDITLEITKPAVGQYQLSLNTGNMNSAYTITQESSTIPNELKYKVQLTDNTYAIVTVNEEYGQITVTFYNETKVELTMVKQDINTKKSLANVEFKVVSKNLATQEENELTASSLTNEEGILAFDLGVAPQNATYEYTFTELRVPEGEAYTVQILPQVVTVTYDMYGKISKVTTNSKLRTKAFLEHQDDNCREIFVTIGNGTVDPKYKVKVVSEDIDTGRRINGSEFDVEVKAKESGNTLMSRNATTGGNITSNLCTDGRFHLDSEVKEKGYKVSERGIILTDTTNYSGEIEINVNQIGFASGYVPGNQKTTGKVIANASFIDDPNGGMDSLLKLDIKDNSGLEVNVDEQAREIIITVKNESNITLTLTKLSSVEDENGQRAAIKGATFTVTSEIVTSTTSTATDLNVETRATGVDGVTSEAIGKSYPGKTVIYTIHENEIEGYKSIEDIKIAVVYDLKGNITYTELLSAYTDVLNWTEVANSFTGGREISISVLNEPIVGEYRVILEKHDIDDGLYPDLIPGAEYEIVFEEQFGERKTWTDITDSTGTIRSGYFNGYGTINIKITEISAPEGYEIDPIPKYIVLFRDKETGIIHKYSSDVNIDVETDKTKVVLKPVDKGADNTYNFTLDKVDADTGRVITNDTAEFEVTITKFGEQQPTTPDETQDNQEHNTTQDAPQGLAEGLEEVTGDTENTGEGEDTLTTPPEDEDASQGNTITYKSKLSLTTDKTGRVTLREIPAPEEEGDYVFTINEVKVPNGYEKDPEEVAFKITFGRDARGVMQVKAVEPISGKYASVVGVTQQAIVLSVGNKSKETLPSEGKYTLNIYKVDEEGNNITNAAIFKVTMPNGTTKYVETKNSRLNLEQFDIPTEEMTQEYVIQEIMAPEGYIISREPINISINFVKDENGEIVLKASNIAINTQGSNIYSAELKEENAIEVKIKNEEGTIDSGVDRGRYNIILTKIDANTKQIIPKEAEITVALENGQRILSRTKEDAKITILDIKAPARAGEYEYVIRETKAPEGYELNEDPQIFKITFEESPDDPTQLVITKAEVVFNEDVSSIIEVTSFAENTVEINVENKKNEEDTLYLKSKVDEANEVIYNVYQKEDVPYVMPFEKDNKAQIDKAIAKGQSPKVYQVDTPVIDTKTMLKKATRDYRGISVKEFIENLDTNAEKVTIYDYDGNEVSENNLIKTEYKLKATKGTQELNYTIVVKGDCVNNRIDNDVPGNGMLTLADKTCAMDASDTKKTTFNDLSLFQKMAVDYDNNGLITLQDYSQFKTAWYNN